MKLSQPSTGASATACAPSSRARSRRTCNAWDEAETFPRELYRRPPQLGLLGLGYPEALRRHAGRRLVPARSPPGARPRRQRRPDGEPVLAQHRLPPIAGARVSEALQQRMVPAVLRGEKIAALAITEPGGRLGRGAAAHARRGATAALGDRRREDVHHLGHARRLDHAGRAHRRPGRRPGISLIAVPGDAPGLTRTPLDKMGWWCSDTAQLRFDGCRVPARPPDRRGGRGLRRSWRTSTASG